jgi:hypothetical protein
MTLAEAAALVAMPVLFGVWGATWALPRDLYDSSERVRPWTDARVVVGTVAVVVGMNLGIVDVLGSLTLRIVVFAFVPFVAGYVAGRAVRAHRAETGPPDRRA